jgi:hypothetical protein|nr:MAG TPA: hypothetical protein [Caudoviricetes sp.]
MRILTSDLAYRRIEQDLEHDHPKKTPPAVEVVAAHEPLHLVEYKLTMEMLSSVSEVMSVRRVVRESQIERELARVKETYEQLYLFSKVVSAETIYILKDLGAYNLAVVTPYAVEGADRIPLTKKEIK